jgi:glycosyltransferase involved in cell wall biosynthesis
MTSRVNVLGVQLGHATFGSISGGDRHSLEVWSEWSRRAGCEVEILTSNFGAETCRRFRYDLRLLEIGRRSKPLDPYRIEYLRRCLSALVRAATLPAYDFVYASSTYFYDVFPALFVSMRSPGRTRVIASVFHLIPPPQKRGGNRMINVLAYVEQRVMLLLLRHFASHVIVDNTELRGDLQRIGFRLDRIVLSQMGVRVRAPLNGGAREGAVYVGRFSGPKGVDVLLEAWRLVCDSRPESILRLVGRDEGGFSARGITKSLGLESNVIIEDTLSDDEVTRLLQSSLIFVTASREEGYGLSLLEALAAGTPSVTFDIPAFRSAFPRGRIVATGYSREDLAAAILSAFGDERRLTEAREDIVRMSIPTWAHVAGDLWARMIGNGGSSG